MHILHAAVPGRLRLHVPALRRSAELGRMVEAALAARPEVRSVAVSVWTGNVLVAFAPTTPRRAIVAAVRAALPPPAAVNGWRVAVEVPQERRRPARVAPRRKRLPPPRPAGEPEAPWHAMAVDDLVRRLDGDARRGLPETAARERLLRDGANVLQRRPRRSELMLFIGQLATLPVALLAGSAALSLATGGLVDAVVIGGVIFLNAAIGYVTERHAEQVINALDSMEPPPARVLRDGQAVEIAAEEVVRGDVLLLDPGTMVAADARLVEAVGLAVDESLLTGESLPVAKSSSMLAEVRVALADRANMVFRATAVAAGNGRAIVVATGPATEVGRIQALLGEVSQPETPLQIQLHRMGRQLVGLCCGICAGIFALGILRGLGTLPMLKTSASLAVAALPEGLPAIATTTLALGIGRMREHKVLVRHLQAIETLGAVQSLCFDKTGTLTLNRMSVTAVALGARILHVEPGKPLAGDGELAPEGRRHLDRLLTLAVLCNEAQVNGEGGGALRLDGSPTEKALIELALVHGIDPKSLRARHPPGRVELRSETRPWMTTFHLLPEGGRLAAVKGNPAAVLKRCGRQLDGDRELPLDEEARRRIEAANASLQTEGLRVLGFAYARAAEGAAVPEEDLVWVGLAGMTDPIRPGMPELMQVLHGAEIKTVMITGDQSGTAYAIARQLRLGGDGDIEILDSTRLDQLDPEMLHALAARADVFARVSPTHKLQIVQAMQRGGRVVAMTGDGVNDGPALKAADVGVAMGRGGTEVARSVADIVLAEDDLATMADATAQGRTIYDNIRKSIHYLLATNMSEIIVTGGGVALGTGELLSPIQLLWINLVSDVFPALALALEPSEPDIMRRPPRDPATPILRPRDFRRFTREALLMSAGSLGVYILGRGLYGPGPQVGTMVFSTVTAAQLLHAIGCRSEHLGLFSRERLGANPYLRTAIPAGLALQAGTLLVPGLRRLLGLTPLGLVDLAVVAAGASLPLLANEAIKASGWEREDDRRTERETGA